MLGASHWQREEAREKAVSDRLANGGSLGEAGRERPSNKHACITRTGVLDDVDSCQQMHTSGQRRQSCPCSSTLPAHLAYCWRKRYLPPACS